MTRSPISALFLTTTLLFAGVGAGTLAGQEAAERVRDPYGPIDTLIRVLALVEASWVDEITTEDLVEAALTGMVDSLDRHSSWMPAARWHRLQEQTQGRYTGLGAEVRLTDSGAEVVRVLPDSPADRVGLQADDLILTLDGAPITRTHLDPETRNLLAPPEIQTTLEVLREGWQEPRALTTQREILRQPSVYAERIDGATAWMRVDQFRNGSAADLRAALRDLSDGGGLRGLILDLRDNPGGLLREAIDVADTFLSEGLIASTEGRTPDDRDLWNATSLYWDGALIVLINGASASGSEIVAAALQDRGRALLVGTPTYGKGSVQTVFEHRDGSALKLTVGRYLTPSGQPVADRKGRAPDHLVPWPSDADPREQLRRGLQQASLPEPERAALLAWVDALPDVTQQARRSDIPWGVPVRDRLSMDPQLSTALTLLRGDLPPEAATFHE